MVGPYLHSGFGGRAYMLKKFTKCLPTSISYLLISLVALRDFILSGRGTSVNGWVGDPWNFAALRLSPYAWNVQLSRQDNLSQYFFNSMFSPFVELAKIVQSDMFTLLPWILLILFFIAGFSANHFCREILFDYKLEERKKELVCLLCGAFYMSYPFFAIGEIYEYPTFVGFCLFPLVAFLFLRAYRMNSYRAGIVSVLVASIISFADLRYLILSIFIILLIVLVRIISSGRPLIELKRKMLLITVVVIAFALIAVPSLFIYSLKESGEVQIPLNGDSIGITWSLVNPLTLLNGYSWFELDGQIGWDSSVIPKDVMMVIAFLPVVIALVGVIKRRKIDADIFMLLLISMGTWALFCIPNFYEWLVLSSPGNEFFGRMFRAPRIPAQLICLGITGLLAIGMTTLVDIERPFFKGKISKIPLLKKETAITLAIIIVLLLTLVPLIQNGSPSKYLNEVVPSTDYLAANDAVGNIIGRSLWFPFNLAPIWYESLSGRSLFNSYNSLGGTVIPNDNRWVHFYLYLNSNFYNLITEDDDAISTILHDNGFSNIVVSNETAFDQMELEMVTEALLGSDCFELTFENDNYRIFNLIDAPGPVTISNLAMIGGGYSTLQRIASLLGSEYIPAFIDDQIGPEDLEAASLISLSGLKNEFDLAYPYLNENSIYTIAQLGPEGAKYITDPHHGSWHSYLGRFGEHLWEFGENLNYGFFTFESVDHVEFKIDCQETAEYQIWIRALVSTIGGNLTFSIDEEPLTIARLDNESIKSAEFQWINIAHLSLQEGSHSVMIDSDSANNAINVMAVVPISEYERCINESKIMLESKKIVSVVDLSSGLNDQNLTTDKNVWIPEDAFTIFAWQGGDCSIEVNSIRIDLNNVDPETGWNHSDPIYLPMGTSTIHINITGIDMDDYYLIALQSSDETSFNDFFDGETTGDIISVEQLSPYEYAVDLTAKNGTVLVFDESYHALWTIDGLGDNWTHVPLSGTINGYIIVPEVNSTVEIKFLGEEDYSMGYWFFILTVGVFTVYLSIYIIYNYLYIIILRDRIKKWMGRSSD